MHPREIHGTVLLLCAKKETGGECPQRKKKLM